LRQAIRSLSRTQQVAMLLDRRVDPGRELEMKLDEVPLGTALHQIAQNQGLGVSLLGPVAYFGPPAVAARLRTLSAVRTEEVRKLPPTVARPFFQAKPIAWPDFATPRNLLQELAEQNNFVIEGLAQVPHDLWAGTELPALSLVERLTLIAVQFDLTFTVSADGKTVTLLPISDNLAITRSYEGGRQPEAVAAQYAVIAPDAKIKVVGVKVWVRGSVEDHERIAAPRRPAKPAGPPREAVDDLSRIRIDKMLVREVPVGQVLEDVAKKLKLDVRIDDKALAAAGVSLDQRVSVAVENVTVDELLRQVTAPAHLQFHRSGKVVEIGPAVRNRQ
jgi:hypothetical protein